MHRGGRGGCGGGRGGGMIAFVDVVLLSFTFFGQVYGVLCGGFV